MSAATIPTPQPGDLNTCDSRDPTYDTPLPVYYKDDEDERYRIVDSVLCECGIQHAKYSDGVWGTVAAAQAPEAATPGTVVHAVRTPDAAAPIVRADGWKSYDGGLSWHHPAPHAAATVVSPGSLTVEIKS